MFWFRRMAHGSHGGCAGAHVTSAVGVGILLADLERIVKDIDAERISDIMSCWSAEGGDVTSLFIELALRVTMSLDELLCCSVFATFPTRRTFTLDSAPSLKPWEHKSASAARAPPFAAVEFDEAIVVLIDAARKAESSLRSLVD
jgi:hypothetical protein